VTLTAASLRGIVKGADVSCWSSQGGYCVVDGRSSIIRVMTWCIFVRYAQIAGSLSNMN
jgi:hypothetical protein